jgi:uncharacterized protein (TIGR00369 family)
MFVLPGCGFGPEVYLARPSANKPRSTARNGWNVAERRRILPRAYERNVPANIFSQWVTMMSENKAYGVVSPAEQREMSGLEFVRGLVSGSLPLNTMAKTLGYDVVEAEEGRVVIAAMPGTAHLNPNGTVHGGVAATLLDSCMGLAVRTLLPKGVGSTTLEFKISFLRPVTLDSGLLRAEGTVLMVGRRIGTAEGKLTGSDGRLLVHGTTTCLNLQ